MNTPPLIRRISLIRQQSLAIAEEGPVLEAEKSNNFIKRDDSCLTANSVWCKRCGDQVSFANCHNGPISKNIISSDCSASDGGLSTPTTSTLKTNLLEMDTTRSWQKDTPTPTHRSSKGTPTVIADNASNVTNEIVDGDRTKRSSHTSITFAASEDKPSLRVHTETASGLASRRNAIFFVSSSKASRYRKSFGAGRSLSEANSTCQKKVLSPRPGGIHSCSTSLTHVSSLDKSSTSTSVSKSPSNRSANDCHHESSISDIGVEFLKATGVIGVRFKQLQKPQPSSTDSGTSSLHRMIHIPEACSESSTQSDERETTLLTNVRQNKSTIVSIHGDSVTSTAPLTGNENNVNINNREAENPLNQFGYRLGKKKILSERRRKITDICCGLAMFGLLLMVIQTECSISGVFIKQDHGSDWSLLIKGLISISTVALLVMIFFYHVIEVKMFLHDNCIEDWRIAISGSRIAQFSLEMILCAIHPPPCSAVFTWSVYDLQSDKFNPVTVPIDIFFSLPMIIRLYLVFRFLLLHSHMFTDASSRSIGAINKISFNGRFVMKTLMTIFPGTVLGVFILSLWIVCAWMVRACENYHNEHLKNFLNALYMVAITFLSVGYGDFVPKTYCGRFISVLAGLVGAGCCALVVAVIAKKLELTTAEKHVHNFMLESNLSKKLKDAAANVLRETWLIYRYTKLVHRVNVRKVRSHQRRFLSAIQMLRWVKLKQQKLRDQASGLTDFAKTSNHIHDIVSDLRYSHLDLNERIVKIETSLEKLQDKIDSIPAAIEQLMANKTIEQRVEDDDMKEVSFATPDHWRQSS